MATTTDLGRVRERSTGRVTAVMKDELGAVIPAASMTSLKLTLYDVLTGTVLNARDAQNVLNANDVTLDATGTLVWQVRPADHALVGTSPRALEKHRAVFDFTWASGAKRDWHALEFLVEAEPKVS